MPTIDSYPQGTPCYVELTTPDPGAAKAFYGELFGWTPTDMPAPDGGTPYVSVSVEGDTVAGIAVQLPEQAGHPAFWGVYLAVDDVDATVAAVPTAGGTVEARPFDVMELGRMAAIQDPTGARVNLWEAREAIGTQRANEPGTPIWNELVSPDIDTATGFYAELLGVTWEDTPMAEDSMLASYRTLQVEGRAVGGALPPPMEGLPPHWNVYFNVADVEQSIATALSLGGSSVVPAFDVPDVGRMAMLADPQGGSFWLMGASPAAA
ncbi:VOC family protein [Nocardioides sp. BP30]|uniref:VOC family protein n=1 Tax=Nocardioides sp. BP30 TaxID=3036374 RepID=UPI0024696832|nr:VOC family protein [Nocardioides sp. BP30]WGL52655.1 VOC family protein [Nocardioides sp. BP30]